jgi:hypothetical protein
MNSSPGLERARSAYVHACRFMSAHELIQQRNDFQGAGVQLIAPMAVLEAFAIELLLKCLILSEGKEPGKIHDLAALFQKLHPNRKRKIVDAWDIGPRAQIDSVCRQFELPSDLPNALVKCGRAFEDLRYAHEDPSKPIFYLGKLPRLLTDQISASYPEWVSWISRD